jgi:hypothetical protein
MVGTIVYVLVAAGSILVGDGVHPDISIIKMAKRKREFRILIGYNLIELP